MDLNYHERNERILQDPAEILINMIVQVKVPVKYATPCFYHAVRQTLG